MGGMKWIQPVRAQVVHMLKRIITSILVKERMPFTNVCYAIVQPLDNVKEMVVRGIGTHLYHYSDLPYNEFNCDICPIVLDTGCCNYCIFNSKCCPSKD